MMATSEGPYGLTHLIVFDLSLAMHGGTVVITYTFLLYLGGSIFIKFKNNRSNGFLTAIDPCCRF